MNALKSWIRRNPLESGLSEERDEITYAKRDQGFRRGYSTQQTRASVYCEEPTHKSIECRRVTSFDERIQILATNKHCFNCAGPKHRAVECNSKVSCRHCSKKHHTSLCDRQRAHEAGMTTSHVENSAVIHPVVVAKVTDYKFRALLDSGVTYSYASSTLVTLTKAELKASGVRQIAMLMELTTRTLQENSVKMNSVTGDFTLDVNVTKVDKRELLSLENPKYKEALSEHPHLTGVQLND